MTRTTEADVVLKSAESVGADAEDVQLTPRTSFVTADRDRDAERVDAIAGSEFIDDRIRLRD